MGTFGRDTLAVCFLNILSYCPRPVLFLSRLHGCYIVRVSHIFCLEVVRESFGAKNPTAHFLFSGIPFTEWQAPNLQTVRHVSWQRANDPIGEILFLKSDILISHNKNPLKIMGIPSYGKPGLPRSHGPWGI